MSDLATLLAKRFIQRRDVKAVQRPNGEYNLHTIDGRRESPRLPWKMSDIHSHLEGTATYGHYLLDQDSKCKLFAFDLDLETEGFLPTRVLSHEGNNLEWHNFTSADPREAWRDRKHHARVYMKYQLRLLAEKLAGVAARDMDLPVAMAYSGAKGVHVYCFTGPVQAEEARIGAELVLQTLGEFELSRGNNFYRHKDQDPETGYPNISVEVFPKQTSLNGKDLGNLMRLPLGRNVKTPDPTFFIDSRAPMVDLKPGDPVAALITGDPWL